MPTKNAAEQAAFERSAAELRPRLAARERTEARRLAEARRPPNSWRSDLRPHAGRRSGHASALDRRRLCQRRQAAMSIPVKGPFRPKRVRVWTIRRSRRGPAAHSSGERVQARRTKLRSAQSSRPHLAGRFRPDA